MRIAVPTETDPGEARVAATPETVRKFAALGAEVVIEAGAGLKSGIADADYQAAGAKLAADAGEALRGADIVLKVRRPAPADLAAVKRGAVVVAIMDPYGQEAALGALASAGVDAFAMELMPRITRAQSMDVLSSQANLAGYRAVIDAAAEYGRALPMMMTAAGTVPAAKAFIMGVGVAGLQAIATARRLGAIVTATDVRPATKEQVESLGAKFVAVEDDEFKQAETAGGYAKEMSAAYQAKQAALVAAHIAKQDIVITTALIPGRPAPRLITTDMVKSMRRGSVIVDLAVERGGNCEASKPGDVATVNGVTILGHLNVASRLAATASALYARNLFAFVETLIDKAGKALAIKWDDEIVRATCLTRDGAIVHPLFAPKPPAGSEASPPVTPAPATQETVPPAAPRAKDAATIAPAQPRATDSRTNSASVDEPRPPVAAASAVTMPVVPPAADAAREPSSSGGSRPAVAAAPSRPVEPSAATAPRPDLSTPRGSAPASPAAGIGPRAEAAIEPGPGALSVPLASDVAAHETVRADAERPAVVASPAPAVDRTAATAPPPGGSVPAESVPASPAVPDAGPRVEPPKARDPLAPLVIPPALSTAAYEAAQRERAEAASRPTAGSAPAGAAPAPGAPRPDPGPIA